MVQGSRADGTRPEIMGDQSASVSRRSESSGRECTGPISCNGELVEQMQVLAQPELLGWSVFQRCRDHLILSATTLVGTMTA